ncbi:hypothetical protein QQS45_11810 [Alteriqipengyuania flavescens]|uniref:hypothetical protein n=1 Tax=Alteriqipengyuania flavescens TaxID=3053610 RepID=UPI0025B4C4F1|nr:hypothetical protein [Alteriqipengyuania flavescens]WJY18298.1 hypothetical protein QQW98_11805 [Alteriqipengyuania flavescens]WJY24239.1 hypothetical protein QQS45_11810 [Alteriqipengyuania flavescens]
MPYDPSAPSLSQRSAAYAFLLLGAVDHAIATVLFAFDASPSLASIMLALSAGAIIGSALPYAADDYLRQLNAVGHRWVMAVLGIATFVFALVGIGHFANSVGRLASGAEASGEPSMVTGLIANPLALCLALGAVFYLGAGFAWARDRFAGNDDA